MKVKKKVRRFLSDDTPSPTPENKTYLEWVKVPEKEVWPTANVHVWNSRCGTYKVYRIQSRYRDDAPSYASTVKREVAGVPSFHMIESDALGPGYPKKYKSLDLALASAESHVAKATKSLVDSNKQTILSFADRMQAEGEFDKNKKDGVSFKTPEPNMNSQSPVSESRRKGKTMEIVRSEAVALLKELGYKVSDSASNKKLTSMVAKIEEGSPIEDNDKLQELYDAVLEAIEEETPPVVVNEEEEEEEEKEEKPAKKAKAEKKKEEKEEKEEKPAKKAKAEKGEKAEKKEKGIKREGVVAKIVEILQGASSKSPVTKKDILASLTKAFPDREEDGMKATINTQVPSGLKIRKGLTVEKNDNGYWLPSEKKAKK